MSLTDEQLQNMAANDQRFADLVNVHGLPVAVVDCANGGQPGAICMQGNCVNGQRLVMRCDAANGCTIYEQVPC
jgi:hypothetical protein